jgi:hypothetical protein
MVVDGFNYYDGEDGMPTQALEIDNLCIENGVPESSMFVRFNDNQPPNKQGSSGHGHTRVCRVNGVYEGNYGQGVADTGARSYTWMVGSRVGSPSVDRHVANLWMQGTCKLEYVEAAGKFGAYGLYAEREANIEARHCIFYGALGPLGGPGIVKII